jgi:hypothetical protein
MAMQDVPHGRPNEAGADGTVRQPLSANGIEDRPPPGIRSDKRRNIVGNLQPHGQPRDDGYPAADRSAARPG